MLCFQCDERAKDLSYCMSHCDYITVKTEDPDGNTFTVCNDGTNSVTLSDQYQEKIKNSGNVTTYNKVRQHLPKHVFHIIGN